MLYKTAVNSFLEKGTGEPINSGMTFDEMYDVMCRRFGASVADTFIENWGVVGDNSVGGLNLTLGWNMTISSCYKRIDAMVSGDDAPYSIKDFMKSRPQNIEGAFRQWIFTHYSTRLPQSPAIRQIWLEAQNG